MKYSHPPAHRILAVALIVAALGAVWDVWWHMVMVRDTPWEPPHMLIFFGVAVAVVTTFRTWRHARSPEWHRLLYPVIGMPFAAVADQLWHEKYGAEDLSSPLIALSPPHILLVSCFLLAGIFLLPLIHHDRNPRAQELFGSLIFSLLLSCGTFLAMPFHPIFYGFGILGFAGTGIATFVLIAVMLAAADWRPTFAGATLASLVFLLFYSIAFGGTHENPIIKLNPHSFPPIWLNTFAYLIPAFFVDYAQRESVWLRGGIAGFLYGIIMFGLLWYFLPTNLGYSVSEGITAIVSSAIGGIAAGYFLKAIRPDGTRFIGASHH